MQDLHGKLNAGLQWQKAVFNKTKDLFTIKLNLSVRKKRVKCCFRNVPLYGSVTRAHCKVDQKYLDSLEMWCWRRVERISGTDCVKNEVVLHRDNEERSVLPKTKRKEGLTGFVTSCFGIAF
jgi:hypothetical protein